MNIESLKTFLYLAFCTYQTVYYFCWVVVLILVDVHFNEPINTITGTYVNGLSFLYQNSDATNLLLIIHFLLAFSLFNYLVVMFPFLEFVYFYCICGKRSR